MNVIGGLSGDVQETLATLSEKVSLGADTLVFAEGDEADAVYFIEAGKIAILLDKSGRQEEIALLGSGEFFGEMAIFNDDMRGATAKVVNDAVLWRMKKEDFIRQVGAAPEFAAKLAEVLQSRKIELFLKEQLVSSTGVGQQDLHVSIKGDPSLRETAFTRERYESMADKVLPKLLPSLRKLLLDTAVYRVFVGLNNGEVRVCSVTSPFIEEIHTASKIASPAYIERHFPPMSYEAKGGFIREIGECIGRLEGFLALPHSWRTVLGEHHAAWKPVPYEKLEAVLDRLLEMREIPNFYLRNLGLSAAQDAVRMQFNCDGTHIVSTSEYHRFLEENIGCVL